jgi:L-fuculose-phosphate aldolase
MLMQQERELIVEYGKKLITSGLTKGTGGNISIFDRESGRMAISPSGLDYFKTAPKDVVVMDLAANVIESDRKPSSEYAMHSIFYKKREDVNAVVHVHSAFATTLAALRWSLPAVSYLIALAGKDVRCADYRSFGTQELADVVFDAMRDRKAVLMANHGLLTGSGDIHSAFNIAEEIEFCCEIYCRAKSVGEPALLDDAEMANMLERFKSYGQVKK